MFPHVINLVLTAILRTNDLSGNVGPTGDLDLMFLLDGSASSRMSFTDMKHWVANVAKQFDIENDTQVGVVQYSHWMEESDDQPYMKTEVKLGNYKRSDFEEALMKIEFQGYTTYTAHAINKTVEDLIASSRFGKPTTYQVMVVVTDGGSLDRNLLPSSSSYARSLGITTFAVGIGGKKTFLGELQVIANGAIGNNLRVFRTIDDFTVIDSVSRDIKALLKDASYEPRQSLQEGDKSVSIRNSSTPGIVIPRPTGTAYYSETATPNEATKEILFVLDGSASFRIEGFEKVKEMVKMVARNVMNEHTYLGVVQYSHYYTSSPIDDQRYIVTEISIGEFEDYTEFSAAVDNIRHQGYTTYTGRALEKIKNDFVSTERYGMENNKQFAVVVTDGVANDPQLIKPNADALRRLGVTTAVVGVGSGPILRDLQMIATGDVNSEERIYYARSPDDLSSIVPDLLTLFG